MFEWKDIVQMPLMRLSVICLSSAICSHVIVQSHTVSLYLMGFHHVDNVLVATAQIQTTMRLTNTPKKLSLQAFQHNSTNIQLFLRTTVVTYCMNDYLSFFFFFGWCIKKNLQLFFLLVPYFVLWRSYYRGSIRFIYKLNIKNKSCKSNVNIQDVNEAISRIWFFVEINS